MNVEIHLENEFLQRIEFHFNIKGAYIAGFIYMEREKKTKKEVGNIQYRRVAFRLTAHVRVAHFYCVIYSIYIALICAHSRYRLSRIYCIETYNNIKKETNILDQRENYASCCALLKLHQKILKGSQYVIDTWP